MMSDPELLSVSDLEELLQMAKRRDELVDEQQMPVGKVSFYQPQTQKDFDEFVAEIKADAIRGREQQRLAEPVETLHDKYAMAALTGLLACPNILGTLEELSARSFEYADECMKQRGPRNE